MNSPKSTDSGGQEQGDDVGSGELLGKYPKLRPLFMMVFLESMGMAISAPVIPFFIMDEMGASAWELGITVSAFSSTQILGAATFGRCSDAFGRQPIVVFCFIWTAIGCAATAHVQTFNQLLLARFLTGISGGTWPICQAYLLDIVVDSEERGKYMGMLAATFASAFIFGPGIAYLLLTYTDTTRRAIFTLSSLICLLGAFVGSCCLKESLPVEKWRPLSICCAGDQAAFEAKVAPPQSDWEAVNVGLSSMWLLRFFISFCQFLVYTIYAPFIDDTFGWDDNELGILLMTGACLAVFCQAVLFGRINNTWGKHSTLGLGCFCAAFGALALPTVGANMTFHIAVGMIFIMGEGYIEPGTPICIAAYASERHLGFSNGWGSAFRGMAAIIAPLVGGYLYKVCGGCAFHLAGIAATIAGFLVIFAKVVGTEYSAESDKELLKANETYGATDVPTNLP